MGGAESRGGVDSSVQAWSENMYNLQEFDENTVSTDPEVEVPLYAGEGEDVV